MLANAADIMPISLIGHQAGEKPAGGRIKLIQEEEVAARSGKEPAFQYASMLKIHARGNCRIWRALIGKATAFWLRGAAQRYCGIPAALPRHGCAAGANCNWLRFGILIWQRCAVAWARANLRPGVPSYEKIRLVYEANGATCELLALDHTGIATESLAGTAASVLHITPFHSYPSGVTASAAKQLRVSHHGPKAWRYYCGGRFDSEFSLHKRPIETVYAMDTTGSVIYINTFSHSLAPSMRVGYMILPPELMRLYNQKLGFYACSVPLFDQYVLAKFIAGGHFERHLNRVRRQLRRAANADA